MAASYKFEIYKDKSGEFRFRFRAPNGEKMFASEGYSNKASAKSTIKSIVKHVAKAEIARSLGKPLNEIFAEIGEPVAAASLAQADWLKVNDDGSGGMTLHDLAAVYGVSAERIRQIEVAAMKKMRKALSETVDA